MGAHTLQPYICPYCLKRFDTKKAVKAHQKSTRHTTMHKEDGAEQTRALRHHDHERRAELKAERLAQTQEQKTNS